MAGIIPDSRQSSNASNDRVKEIAGLCIADRSMTDLAFDSLLRREGCVPVSLSNFKIAHFHKNAPLANKKQAVMCVVERSLHSKSQDRLYSVTDMKTMKARLVLSEEVCISTSAFPSLCRINICYVLYPHLYH